MRAILYCVLFLALAEAGMIWIDGVPQGEAGPLYAPDRPVLLNLGSSRTKAGLSPDLIGAVIAASGGGDPWVANIWEAGATNVGLFRMYTEQVSDWARRVHGRGIVAIEIRGSAMNDNYLPPSEELWLNEFEAREEAARGAGNQAGRTFWKQIRAGDFSAAARRILWWSRLSRSRAYLERLRGVISGRMGADSSSSTDLFEYLEDREWGRNGHGWDPFLKSKPTPKLQFWRKHYQNLLLKDYRLGGVQTRFFRMLIRRVRADGFEPVLYTMPITEVHRGFYQQGEYRAFSEHLQRVACEEDVRLLDFDSDYEIDLDLFRDSHHLKIDGAKKLSEQFAREVYLPLLRDGG